MNSPEVAHSWLVLVREQGEKLPFVNTDLGGRSGLGD